jgi:demethoxyubiquinone hydroxylase (CLK1/Coq7/Cat5 family)
MKNNKGGVDQTIDVLNSFLRGEISAVETYDKALATEISNPSVEQQLRECHRSHQMRVDILREEIEEVGGTPSETSGAWGAFANLVEGGATLLGERATIATLESGEDHGLADYQREMDSLDAEARELVEMELLPEQERTHDIMSMLKRHYG